MQGGYTHEGSSSPPTMPMFKMSPEYPHVGELTALQAACVVWAGQGEGPTQEETGGGIAMATHEASQLLVQQEGCTEQTYREHEEQLSRSAIPVSSNRCAQHSVARPNRP